MKNPADSKSALLFAFLSVEANDPNLGMFSCKNVRAVDNAVGIVVPAFSKATILSLINLTRSFIAVIQLLILPDASLASDVFFLPLILLHLPPTSLHTDNSSFNSSLFCNSDFPACLALTSIFKVCNWVTKVLNLFVKLLIRASTLASIKELTFVSNASVANKAVICADVKLPARSLKFKAVPFFVIVVVKLIDPVTSNLAVGSRVLIPILPFCLIVRCSFQLITSPAVPFVACLIL